jgi:O-antigen ligase
VPLYLLLCIVLGGSTQGIYSNLALQLIGLLIISWSLIARPAAPLALPARPLLLLAGATTVLLLLHLVPLPPALWTMLPGREGIAEAYRLAGQAMPWLPISVVPYDTMATGLTLVPPLAVLTAMLFQRAYRPSWIAAAILLGTFAAVLLGALQVGSADPLKSPWYFYRHSNFGFATGFFANSNHMGALLVVSIPFLVALVRRLRESGKRQRSGPGAVIVALAGVLTLGVGVILNGSLAVLLLGVPAAAISATMLLSKRRQLRKPAIAAALVSLTAVLVVYLSPLHERLIGGNASSAASRQQMWSTTVPAIGDFMPLGSGAGTFADVYPAYEDPAEVTPTIVNHAHNDYLEAALEFGLPGVVLILIFLAWWTRRARLLWRPTAGDVLSQAAIVASAVLLLHSLVDFPLRMPALSAILAACLAMMAEPRQKQDGETEELWPTRHLRI